ncbi:MAG: hypothetical protein AAGK14_04625 [Verrucomicrobiota bacterium]
MKFKLLLSLATCAVLNCLPVQAGEQPLAQKLEETKISFKVEAPVSVIFMYASSLSGVPINATKVRDDGAKLQVEFKDATTKSVVREVCRLANLTYELTPDAVLIKPAKLAGGAPAEPVN